MPRKMPFCQVVQFGVQRGEQPLSRTAILLRSLHK